MLRVGLTGGLACGKSTVAKMMADRGAYVVDADKVAHELMSPGQPVYDEVVRLFGRSIVHEADGTIDRKKLGELVFGSGRIQELNAIVHPAVRWAVAKEIVTAWILTIPASALLGALFYWLSGLLG